MIRFFVLTLCLVTLAVILCPVVEATIVSYDVQQIGNVESFELPFGHWGAYDDDVCDQPGAHESIVGSFDDAPYFPKIGITAPFFDIDEASFYVSSDGFLALAEAPMCGFFCAETSYAALYGDYTFKTGVLHYKDGGGNWPMIGLYVADLDPSSSPESTVCVGPLNKAKERNGASWQTVDYRLIPVRGSKTDTLTAQVTVFSNGTIIMRYRKAPSSFVEGSVGLIFGKKPHRHIVTTPDNLNHVYAYRFDPVLDECTAAEGITSASECFEVSTSCGWCSATSTCMLESASGTSCIRTQFIKREPDEPKYGQQRFYDVQVSKGRDFFQSTEYQPTEFRLGDFHNKSPVPISLSTFSFPMFGQSSTTLHLIESAMFSVVSSRQDCNPLWFTCPNGNVSMTILPFQTAAAWPSDSTLTKYALPQRAGPDDFCDSPTSCPPAIVLQVRGMIPYKPVYGNMAAKGLAHQNISFQLYLDRNGVVDILYASDGGSDGAQLVSYPFAQIGLVRNQVKDLSSVIVPWAFARAGTGLRFTPATACRDCGMKGYCDEATGSCVCAPGVVGEACDRCAPGFFGPSCTPCPTCLNYGACNDGIEGEGGCQCSAAFAGPNCGIACPPDQPSRCGECNFRNGYCTCGGGCVCRNGWSGPSCEVPPSDTCQQYTLDGCPTCTLARGCAFCFDSTCFSGVIDPAHMYTCSSYVDQATLNVCQVTEQPRSSNMDYGVVMLLFLITAGCVCVVLVVVQVYLVCMRRNIFDMQVALASGGAVNYKPIRKERDVVQTAFIPPGAVSKNSFVMAVPLKQRPMEQIYNAQRGITKGNKAN